MAFNAYESDGDKITTKVTLLDINEKNDLPSSNVKGLKAYIQREQIEGNTKKATPFYVYEDVEVLDEVLVEGKKGYTGEFKKESKSLFNVEPDHVIVNEGKKSGNILYHLGGLPGVSIDVHFMVAHLRGNAFGPLWIIDGVRFETNRNIFSQASNSPLYQVKQESNIPPFISNMDISNVERIEILKRGSQTAIYGPEGKYGVIIIYTKTGAIIPNNAFSSKKSPKAQYRCKFQVLYPKFSVRPYCHCSILEFVKVVFPVKDEKSSAMSFDLLENKYSILKPA